MKLTTLDTLFAGLLIASLVAACGGTPAATAAPPPTAEPARTAAPAPATAVPSNPAPLFDFSQPLTPVPIPGSYQFTEGPEADADGDVYFSDIEAGKIYKWAPAGTVTVFVSGLNEPNGLMFDRAGNLIACEGGNGRLIAIDPQGRITVLADQYNGVRFNEPNDLWVDPLGGIYFTDPAYRSPVVQPGQDVYYLPPDRSRVLRVIDDLIQPNGIVGTPDGKRLYVADYAARQTFAYDIAGDGALSNKRLFIASGSDGMDLDPAGNIYLTTNFQIRIYDSSGSHLLDIPLKEDPTNLAFAGADGRTLFITARTAVYTIAMPVKTAGAGFALSSPVLAEGGALPAEYTCDGAASTLPLAWSGAPAGTRSFVVIMHHVASPTDVHWYWVLYDIPPDVTSLPKNVAGVGTLGVNSVNGRNAYTPPCSKGPGAKTYTYTVYALSAWPQPAVPAAQVTRAALLDAIQGITLASAELHVTYTRPFGSTPQATQTTSN